MMKGKGVGALALILLPASGSTWAADAGENILFSDIPSVYGASKYDQSVDEAPASVSIITAAEIRRYGYRTLGDILRSVRGLYITYDRNYAYVGVRGFSRPTDYNSRVLITLDGHRTNENIYHMAMVGSESFIDVDLIDRVEVIRGPSSSIYGTSAFFAVVNVITKRGRDFKGGEVSAEYGSLNTRAARATYGTRSTSGAEFLVSARTYASDGQDRLYYPEYDTPATNNGIAENLDSDRARNAFFKGSVGDFGLTAAMINREKAVPTASYDSVFNNPNQATTDQQGFISLSYDREFGAHSRLNLLLSFDSYRYDGTYANAYVMPGGVLTRDYGYGNWLTTEAQFTTRIGDNHRLLVGLEYQGNRRQDQASWEVDPYLLYFRDERNSNRWAVYAQDEWRLTSNTLLNLGARFDQYSEWGGASNPRAALIHKLGSRTVVKLMYGRAFRAPSPYELYYTPSPWLVPETIQTTELALEYSLRRDLRAIASLYHYEVHDLINQQPDYTYRNTGDARAAGLELGFEGRLAGRLEGRLSYSFQQVEDLSTGDRLSNSPQHLAKLGAHYPFWQDRIIAGLELHYMSQRYTLAGAETDSTVLGNFTLLTRGWVKGLELSVSVYNLGDTEYADPGGVEHVMDSIPQDGRTWRIKARYEF
jgi:iron complex outermembrane receptor protein